MIYIYPNLEARADSWKIRRASKERKRPWISTVCLKIFKKRFTRTKPVAIHRTPKDRILSKFPPFLERKWRLALDKSPTDKFSREIIRKTCRRKRYLARCMACALRKQKPRSLPSLALRGPPSTPRQRPRADESAPHAGVHRDWSFARFRRATQEQEERESSRGSVDRQRRRNAMKNPRADFAEGTRNVHVSVETFVTLPMQMPFWKATSFAIFEDETRSRDTAVSRLMIRSLFSHFSFACQIPRVYEHPPRRKRDRSLAPFSTLWWTRDRRIGYVNATATQRRIFRLLRGGGSESGPDLGFQTRRNHSTLDSLNDTSFDCKNRWKGGRGKEQQGLENIHVPRFGISTYRAAQSGCRSRA